MVAAARYSTGTVGYRAFQRLSHKGRGEISEHERRDPLGPAGHVPHQREAAAWSEWHRHGPGGRGRLTFQRDGSRRFAAAHGIGKVHDPYEALLADPDVDAVYIPLPNALHHPWTLKAIAAGKHVLCEKPYTRHPAEVDEAWDAAEAAGVVLMEAYMWRHTPQAARLKELAGQIGELVHVCSTFSHRLGDDADIRVDAELEGGSLMDVGCYCISGSRLVAGEEPVQVYGEQVADANGVDRRFTGVLRFPSGLVATFHSGSTRSASHWR